MNNNENSNSIKNEILKAIEKGKVKMKPRWHFVLRAALLVVGAILLSLAILYLISFIFFVLHQTGIWFAPRLGFRGLGIFFMSLPWLLILVAMIFIIMLELIFKQNTFTYKKPLLYSTIGLVIFVLLGGLLISKTPFHRGLFDRARDNRLPFGGAIYREFGINRPPENFAIGMVTETNDFGYIIRDPREDIIRIIVNDQTEFPAGRDVIVNDHIMVIGQRNSNEVTAQLIREVHDKDLPFPPPAGVRMKIPPR